MTTERKTSIKALVAFAAIALLISLFVACDGNNGPGSVNELLYPHLRVTDDGKIYVKSGFDSEKVTIPGGLTTPSGNNATIFAGYESPNDKDSLKNLVLGDGITQIGDEALKDAGNLGKVTLPDSLTNIGEGAFNNSGLQSVEIPESVDTIGNNAFGGDKLTSAKIPASLTEKGTAKDIFPSLEEVTITGTGDIGAGFFKDVDTLSKVTLPDGIKEIGDNAFNGTKLGDINLPEGLESIGSGAFANTTGEKKEFTLPSTIKYVPEDAFENTNGDVTVILTYKVFSSIDSLEKGTLKKQVLPNPEIIKTQEIIDLVNYVGKVSPESIQQDGKDTTLAEVVDDLGNWNKDEITVELPLLEDGYTGYPYHLTLNFADPNLVYTLIPNSNPEAYQVSIRKDGHENPSKVEINSTYRGKPVTKIADDAFNGVSSLEDVVIPEGITDIGTNAFKGTNLGKNYLPDGGYAGKYDEETGSWTDDGFLPDGLINIGAGAFDGTSIGRDIKIPDTVESIGEGAFANIKPCIDEGKNVGTIQLPNTALGSVSDILTGDNAKKPVSADRVIITGKEDVKPQTLKPIIGAEDDGSVSPNPNPELIVDEIVIGTGITEIGEGAFQGVGIPDDATGDGNPRPMKPHIKIDLPDTVTSIGKDAFKDMPKIVPDGTTTGIIWFAPTGVLPDDIKVDGGAFSGDSGYPDPDKGGDPFYPAVDPGKPDVGIGVSKITSIGDEAFKDNKNIKRVTIPASCTYIGVDAFKGCTNLTEIIFEGVREQGIVIADGAFEGVDIEKISHLEDDTYSEGENGVFDFDRVFGDNVTGEIKIGENAFNFGNESNIDKVVLPGNTTSVNDNSFKADTEIEITLPVTGFMQQETYPDGGYPTEEVVGNVTFTGNVGLGIVPETPRKYGYDFVWTVGNTASSKNELPEITSLSDLIANKGGSIAWTAKTWGTFINEAIGDGVVKENVVNNTGNLTFDSVIPGIDVTLDGFGIVNKSYADTSLVAGEKLTKELVSDVGINTEWNELITVTIGGKPYDIGKGTTYEELFKQYPAIAPDENKKYTSESTSVTIEPDKKIDLKTPITGDIILTEYSKVKFSIDGGKLTDPPEFIKTGTTPDELKKVVNPTRTGYDFNSWTLKTDPDTGVITASANWTAKTWTVTLNANASGATVTPDSITATYGETGYSQLSNVQATRTGYTFASWNTSANGAGEPITSTSIADDMTVNTLYAQWKVDSLNITIGGKSYPVDYGTTYQEFFNKNNDLKPKTDEIYSTSTGLTANSGIDMDSQITKSEILTKYSKVTFDSNGGSSITSVYVNSEKLNELNTNSSYKPTKTGYTFESWSFETNPTTGAITATANWTANTYTVTLNANGGIVSPAFITVTFDSTYSALSGITPTKVGYEFTGWYTEAGGTGTQVTKDTTVTRAEDHFLYAKWESKTVSIVYNGDGYIKGELPKNTSVQVGGTFGSLIPNNSFAKQGYTCIGWKDQSGNQVTSSSIIPDSETITLSPIWKPIKYNVGFNTNNKGVFSNYTGSSYTPYISNEHSLVITNTGDKTYSCTGYDEKGNVWTATLTLYESVSSVFLECQTKEGSSLDQSLLTLQNGKTITITWENMKQMFPYETDRELGYYYFVFK